MEIFKYTAMIMKTSNWDLSFKYLFLHITVAHKIGTCSQNKIGPSLLNNIGSFLVQ